MGEEIKAWEVKKMRVIDKMVFQRSSSYVVMCRGEDGLHWATKETGTKGGSAGKCFLWISCVRGFGRDLLGAEQSREVR